MPPWRETALRIFPELTPEIERAEDPYFVWFALREAFEAAYESTPRDECLIRRVYEYSDWCISAPRGETAEDDLPTIVCTCFYEHIPEQPAARDDMPRWFRYEDFLGTAQIFRYHLLEEDFLRLQDHMRRNQDRYVPRPEPIHPQT